MSVLCSETEGMQDKTLTPNIIKNVKNMLAPVEKLTQDLSSYDASLSAVIPAVLGLKLTLETNNRDRRRSQNNESGSNCSQWWKIWSTVDKRGCHFCDSTRSTIQVEVSAVWWLMWCCQKYCTELYCHDIRISLIQRRSPTNQWHQHQVSLMSQAVIVMYWTFHWWQCSTPQWRRQYRCRNSSECEVAAYFSDTVNHCSSQTRSTGLVESEWIPLSISGTAGSSVSVSAAKQRAKWKDLQYRWRGLWWSPKQTLLPENAERLVFLKYNLPLLNFSYWLHNIWLILMSVTTIHFILSVWRWKPLWLDLQPVDIKSQWRHNWRKSTQVVNSHHNLATSLGNSGLCWTVFARNRGTAVPAEGNSDLQTLICVIVARPRRCLTLSNPVPWQNWMEAYLSYTLRIKTLFHGWPVKAHETHTRRRLQFDASHYYYY